MHKARDTTRSAPARKPPHPAPNRLVGSPRRAPNPPRKSRAPAVTSSSRTTIAASSRAISAAKPASYRTATSASTMANPSCRITSWKPSRNNWPERPNFPCPCTRSWFEEETMATTEQVIKPFTIHELKGKVDPDWCPGCGDFGVLAALEKAIVDLQIQPYNVVTISGIGCSSNLPGYINTSRMHTLHRRALAVATGLKLANHDLTVVVTGGDGDGLGIGGNPFLHSLPPNVDLLYILMDHPI